MHVPEQTKFLDSPVKIGLVSTAHLAGMISTVNQQQDVVSDMPNRGYPMGTQSKEIDRLKKLPYHNSEVFK